MTLSICVWVALCLALLWSVFCRLTRTTHATRFSVRLAIFFLGLAALVGLGAPVYGWVPDVVVFCMTGACVCMQIVAARHWRYGVPKSFQRSDFDSEEGLKS